MRNSLGALAAACLLMARTASAQQAPARESGSYSYAAPTGGVSAYLFQAKGMAGSVIDATGCLITYALSCTDTQVCPSSAGITKTITQNGASSFAMSYTSYGKTTSFSSPLFLSAAETCKLFGTSVAYCTATAAIIVGSLSTSTSSIYQITQPALLSYGQVPITGSAAALTSVSSCSASGNVAVVTGYPSTSPSSTTTSSGPPTSSTTAPPPPGGLSTGAKAGIGAGVGAVALGALAGFAFWFLRRRRTAKKSSDLPPAYDAKTTGPPEMDQNNVRYELGQPQMQHELPVGKPAQELYAGRDMYAPQATGPRYELQ